MQSDDTVISVASLSKSYLVGHETAYSGGYRSFRETIVRHVTNFGRNALEMARGRQIVQGDEVEQFWALRDVSFDVMRGERLGVIGRNGAGKSTLLKVISRITEPTKGRVTIKGRVASLLEVGTGFHPELTGRENIYLNGAILGMSRAEVKAKFDEIVAFAETEKFLDTPVKHYSSGMYVRLAFAVAAHLEPEILIIDEVLAVGDAGFQKKCLGKMQEVSARAGRTVLFVSHNMMAIQSLCTRAIVLNEGSITFQGPTETAISVESSRMSTKLGTTWESKRTERSGALGFDRIAICLKGAQPLLSLDIDVELFGTDNAPESFVAVDVVDNNLSPIMQILPEAAPFIKRGGPHHLTLEVDLPPLIPGIYLLSFWIGTHFSSTLEHWKNILSFEIVESPTRNRTFPHSPLHGVIVPRCTYRITPEIAS